MGAARWITSGSSCAPGARIAWRGRACALPTCLERPSELGIAVVSVLMAASGSAAPHAVSASERPHVFNSSLPHVARGELTVVAIGVVLAYAQTFLSSMPYDTRVTLCCSDLDVLHMPSRIHDCPAVMSLRLEFVSSPYCRYIIDRIFMIPLALSRSPSAYSYIGVPANRARSGAGGTSRVASLFALATPYPTAPRRAPARGTSMGRRSVPGGWQQQRLKTPPRRRGVARRQ